MEDQDEKMEKILKSLDSLEQRLSKLESAFSTNGNKSNIETTGQIYQDQQNPGTENLNNEEKGLESQIGRFGLAWLGNIVLLFGIIFLTQYMMNMGLGIIPVLFGYLASGAIFYLAYYIKRSNVHMAFIFRINAQMLLFYMTVRLHFFSVSPLIPQRSVSVIILLLLVVVLAYMSFRNRSQAFAILAVLFTIVTSVLADSVNLTLPIVILTSVWTIYLYSRFDWEPMLIVTILLCYVTFTM